MPLQSDVLPAVIADFRTPVSRSLPSRRCAASIRLPLEDMTARASFKNSTAPMRCSMLCAAGVAKIDVSVGPMACLKSYARFWAKPTLLRKSTALQVAGNYICSLIHCARAVATFRPVLDTGQQQASGFKGDIQARHRSIRAGRPNDPRGVDADTARRTSSPISPPSHVRSRSASEPRPAGGGTRSGTRAYVRGRRDRAARSPRRRTEREAQVHAEHARTGPLVERARARSRCPVRAPACPPPRSCRTGSHPSRARVGEDASRPVGRASTRRYAGNL